MTQVNAPKPQPYEPKPTAQPQPVSAPNPAAINTLAQNQGIDEAQARATITKYRANPQSKEFTALNPTQLRELNEAAGMDENANLVEVNIQKGGGQFVTRSDYERLQKEAPLAADKLRRSGGEAAAEFIDEANKYQKEKAESREKQRVEQAVTKATSREVKPPPGVTEEFKPSKAAENQGKAFKKLIKQGYGSKLDEYPQGGAPFESYETTRAINTAKYLQDNKNNLDKAVKNLKAAGFTKKQIQDARFEAFASKSELKEGKGDTKPPTRTERLETNLVNWMEGLKSEPKQKGESDIAYSARTAAEGGVLVGGTLLLAPALIGLRVINEPGDVGKTAKEFVGGMVAQVGNTASNIASGYYTKQAKEGNFLPFVYDSLMTGLILRVGKGVAKPVLSKVTTYVALRGITPGSIAKEVSTGRIKTPEAFAKQYAEAINKAEKLAAEPGGKVTGQVPIEGTPYSLRYLKTAMQQKIGNVLFHGTKAEPGKVSLLDIAKSGEIKAGESGIYTSPWAALGYTRGGTKPGVVMIVTEASKVKSGVKGLEKGLTQSDKFVREAEPGFYGSSKVWRGDLETEIVGAPGTRLKVPAPKADLTTRALAGNYADFFTYDAGKYIPVKVAIDKAAYNAKTLKSIDNPASWYSVKLYSLYTALRDTAEAVKHPGYVLKDVSGTLKEIANLDRLVKRGEGTKGGQISFPGVRDIYVQTNIRQWLQMKARELYDKAFNKTKQELPKAVPESATFRKALERNMDDVYRANADALIDTVSTVSKGYNTNDTVRSKFEDAYIANLGLATESLAKAAATSEKAIESVTRDIAKEYPLTESAIEYLKSKESPVSPKEIEDIIRIARKDSRGRVKEEAKLDSRGRVKETKDVITRDSKGRFTSEPSEPAPRTKEPPDEPRTKEPPDEPPPPVRFASGMKSDAKREIIKNSDGAIAWRQGELNEKDIWHVLIYPYDEEVYHTTLLGDKPEGASIVEGEESAYKTAQIIRGTKQPVKPVDIDMGIQDVRITPEGKNDVGIKFSPDPKQITKGDFAISKKSPGISPKVPKLR